MVKNININDMKCISCSSKNIVKRGSFQTKAHGKRQRYSCKNCKKKFILQDGFYRMRNTPQKITQSLHLYFSGTSLRKTQEHLGVFHPHNASHVTILKWIRKYSNLFGDFTDNLKINNSQAITFDEMEFKTKGKKSFFIDVMDMDSRYILGSGYYLRRGEKELKEVLFKSKKKSLNKTLRFYTDGLTVYPKVLRKTYQYKKHKKELVHKVTKSSDKAFNWKVERLHGSIRERTKIMRQFNQLHSAKSIMKGYEIHYNFVRKHQGIRCYPYELATNLKLGKNKWLDLINLATNNKNFKIGLE